MESEHDSKVADNMGMDKTVELIGRNFYCHGLGLRAEFPYETFRSCS